MLAPGGVGEEQNGKPSVIPFINQCHTPVAINIKPGDAAVRKSSGQRERPRECGSPSGDGCLELATDWIDILNRGYSEQAVLNNDRVQGWSSDRAWVSWIVQSNQPGPYRVQAVVE